MAYYQRAIDLAFDSKEDRVLDANVIFQAAKAGYEIRTQYNSGELELSCLDCEQALMVSDSKNDRLHFKHFPNAGYCELKDGKMSPLEVQLYTDVLRSKESDRHKFLKNRMAGLLRRTEGVVENSVIADTKFFFGANEKRRPDVYCKYLGKEVVFEIQLSQLSQRYILGRRDFYRSKGMYLIWILDNFNVHGQTQMERDIKYLYKSQNFFRLDESVGTDFRLLCTYKSPFITEKRKLISPWQNHSIALAQLKFDTLQMEVYYKHYEQALTDAGIQLAKLLEDDKEAERLQWQEQVEALAVASATKVFNKLVNYKKRGFNFYKFSEDVDSLDHLALQHFNFCLGFAKKRYQRKPLLHHYISAATKEQFSFIAFLLADDRIEFNVNDTNDDGRTCFQEIYLNPLLDYKQPLIKSIFMRGYHLTAADLALFQSAEIEAWDKEADQFLFSIYERLTDKNLCEVVQKNSGVFNIIESARQQRIIGFRFKNWVSFAVQALSSGRRFWSYIEPAFKYYGLWNVIIANDKKGTFLRKVSELENSRPEQLQVIDEAVREVFPELFDQKLRTRSPF